MDRMCSDPQRVFATISDALPQLQAAASRYSVAASEVASSWTCSFLQAIEGFSAMPNPESSDEPPSQEPSGAQPVQAPVSSERASRQSLARPPSTHVEGSILKRYLFSDEKSRGIVKIYIEASQLGGTSKIEDVEVNMQEQTLFVRCKAVNGSDWLLRGTLFGKIDPSKSKHVLSSSGHKVSITLRKRDADLTWHRLFKGDVGTTASVDDFM
eukprot:TRINITY_DN5501_c2_g3_i2.p1 TRINITY_DN5501_c2_g3~~TRINITY_DN5501_c2_g3_i2.p1  ORF type:complete len:222 (-),score=21.11 TRINITY_DN5501_c2_g3_i2:110-745(-)